MDELGSQGQPGDWTDLYLARTGLKALPSVTGAGLREIQFAQVCSVPFENLNPFLGLPVSLETESLLAKLLVSKRGGYCFELNSLLEWALVSAGFEVEMRVARVQFTAPQPGPRTHMVLIVSLGGRRWLCDAGFGGPTPRCPIPIELGRTDVQGQDHYRLAAGSQFGTCLQFLKEDGDWIPLYFFDDSPALPVDLHVGNYWTSTAPQSFFTQSVMAASTAPEERWAVRGQKFSHRSGSGTVQGEFGSGSELVKFLQTQIGVEMSEDIRQRVEAKFSQIP